MQTAIHTPTAQANETESSTPTYPLLVDIINRSKQEQEKQRQIAEQQQLKKAQFTFD